MNSTDKSKLEKSSKELSILHYAVTFGSFMVTCLLYFFTVKNGQFNFSDTSDIFLYICPVLAIGGVFLSRYLYNMKMKEMSDLNSIDEKLAIYRAASVMKFAFLEGPALLCAIAMMQTQNLFYLVIALLLIAYLFSQKITTHKVIEDLKL